MNVVSYMAYLFILSLNDPHEGAVKPLPIKISLYKERHK